MTPEMGDSAVRAIFKDINENAEPSAETKRALEALAVGVLTTFIRMREELTRIADALEVEHRADLPHTRHD